MAQNFDNLNWQMKLEHLLSLSSSIEKNWNNTEERSNKILQLKACIAKLEHCTEKPLQELYLLYPKIHNKLSLQQFISIVVPIERQWGRTRTDHEFLPDTKKVKHSKPMPVWVALENIRSAFNTGAIFRTADGLNLEGVALTGYTATPENPKVAQTAMGCHETVPWKWWRSTEELIANFRNQGIPVYAVETSTDCVSIYEHSWSYPCVFILGNERFGLDPQTIDQVDGVIKIPMRGHKESLNVATAMSVVCYEALRNWLMAHPDC